jgi:hypothetical protein
MRMKKRHKREREMHMSNMDTEQRAKMLARQQNRDVLENIALGLAKPTLSKESILDSRLFHQGSLSGSFVAMNHSICMTRLSSMIPRPQRQRCTVPLRPCHTPAASTPCTLANSSTSTFLYPNPSH